MNTELMDTLKKLKITTKKQQYINKVLCVIEGKSELYFLKTMDNLILQRQEKISCVEYTTEKVQVAWGKDELNITDECDFRGGSLPQSKVPYPALEAIYKYTKIKEYKAIIVMFDKDEDADNVEQKIKDILEQNTNDNFLLIVSNPCFEAICYTLMYNKDTIDHVEKYIDENYSEINSSKCKWYKQNKQKILQLANKKGFAGIQKILKIFDKLVKDDILKNDCLDTLLKQLIEFYQQKCII